PGGRLLPQPQLRHAGLVRRLAHRRRGPVARLARDGERVVHRSRTLARRAGARRHRADAGRGRRVAAGLHRRALPPRAEEEAPPTLADVARLTRDSDFSRLVGADVDASVSNAALKKLFSDPHFNVMDGLDTYIDDYGRPDPIPPSMLRALNQAASLGLFDSE